MMVIKTLLKTQLFPIFIIFVAFYFYSFIIYEIGRMSAKHEFMTILSQEESVSTDKISIEDLKNDIFLMD